jgi:hypothetical protein
MQCARTQGKVQATEGKNTKLLEEQSEALQDLRAQMAGAEALEAVVREVQEGVQELQVGVYVCVCVCLCALYLSYLRPTCRQNRWLMRSIAAHETGSS